MPLTTLGQETRWAYSTTPRSPQISITPKSYTDSWHQEKHLATQSGVDIVNVIPRRGRQRRRCCLVLLTWQLVHYYFCYCYYHHNHHHHHQSVINIIRRPCQTVLALRRTSTWNLSTAAPSCSSLDQTNLLSRRHMPVIHKTATSHSSAKTFTFHRLSTFTFIKVMTRD